MISALVPTLIFLAEALISRVNFTSNGSHSIVHFLEQLVRDTPTRHSVSLLGVFHKPYWNTIRSISMAVSGVISDLPVYVDVDNYLLNLDPMWTIEALENNLFGVKIPEPNLIIHSGRGLALVWLIDPVPSQALPLWQAVENYFVRQLDKFGGDAKASDAARVSRLAGTVNSKNGENVQMQYRHDYRYTLRDLEREYLPPLSPRKRNDGQQSSVHHRLYKTYTLHYARLMDLLKLCELRGWEMTGFREITLFLYRYWSCCFLKDPIRALEATLETNECFTQPLSKARGYKGHKERREGISREV